MTDAGSYWLVEQVEFADVIVVNKADLVPQQALEQLAGVPRRST